MSHSLFKVIIQSILDEKKFVFLVNDVSDARKALLSSI